MTDFIDEKRIELEGKTFLVHKAPATVAYEIALRYKKAREGDDVEETQTCLYLMLKYVELDLGDGRKVSLDNPTIINQHIKDLRTLISLQKESVNFNFGFFTDDVALNS